MQTPDTVPLSPAKSLRTRFAIIMGISGLVLGMVVTAILEWQLEAFTFEAQQKSLKVAANELNGRLGKDLRARSREIVMIAGVLEKAHISDRADIRSLLDKLKDEQSSYAWIGLTDVTGKVLAATGGQLEGVDTSARPWFSGARQGGLYLGDPHEAKLLASYMPANADNEPVRFVDVAIALNDADGKLQGVLAAHLHWTWVQKSIAQYEQELAGAYPTQFFVADHQGRFLLAPTGEAFNGSSELLEADARSGRFLTATSVADATEFPAGLGWSVMARQSMDDILEPIRRVRTRMVWFAFALGACFVWLTWLVSKRVVQPISDFVEVAKRFQPESGKPFTTEASTRSDELGALAKTMGMLIEKLRIHAGRNQLFIEHAPVSLAIFDKDMRYLSVSQSWLADYGLLGRNILGESHYAIFPEIPEHWRALHRRGMAGEVLISPGECMDRADGTQQWIRWEIRPWYLPDGSSGGIAIFSEDITTRVTAERALLSSEEKFRATFEQAAVGIAHVDLHGRWKMVNKRLCQILGYTREELLEKTFQDITHPDDLERDLERVQALLRGDLAQYQIDKRYLHQNGNIVWVTLTVALVRQADGTPDYFVSVLEDIAERKRAELALTESETRMRLAVEVARVGIFDWDIQQQTIVWSPELEAMYDSPRAPTHSYAEWLSRLHPDDADTVAAKVQSSMHLREAVEHEWRIVLPSQEVRWVSARFQTYPDEAGKPARMFGVNIDITNQKAKEQAEAANLAKSQFLANMSHEIRTPMNGILGLAYVLGKMPIPQDARALVHRIEQTGRTLQSILNDILDFSKIEANQMVLEHNAFTLADVLDSVSTIMLGDASRPEVDVAIAPPPLHMRALLGDGLRLGQVLINLVGNAIKFTHQGFVRLEVDVLSRSEAAATLRFTVRDSGIGISESVMAEIFKPFSQADASTTRKYGGTGLGLSISRKLVALMGGTLEASSTLGRGSAFSFTLSFPFAALPADSERQLQGLDLLIADDSEVSREALRSTALSLGWNPTVVDGGQAALEQVAQRQRAGQKPELLVLDWKMPDLDGLRVAQAVNAQLQGAQGPIIILATAHSRDELLAHADSALADAVLNKPVSASALYDAVAAAMVKRGTLTSNTSNKDNARLRGVRILVVDDSEINREVARLIFEREEALVSTANDGQEALQWLDAHVSEVDLVLMDVQMPVMNGIEATQRIRTDSRFTTLPIVALSAGAFAHDRAVAMDAGMNDHITKPMDVESAVALICALLQPSHTGAA